jgi:Right handed beta helix region
MRAVVLGLALAVVGCGYDRPPLATLDGAATDALVVDAFGNGCVDDSQCASGVCGGDQCVPADEISYVAMNGNDSAACTYAAPCATFARAEAAQAGRTLAQVVIEPGTYTTAITTSQSRLLIVGRPGADGALPSISSDRTDVIIINQGDVTLRHLQVSAPGNSSGIHCSSATLRAVDTLITNVERFGFDLQTCTATIIGARIVDGSGLGIRGTYGSLTVQSSSVQHNLDGGVRVLSATAISITGSVLARNGRQTTGTVTGSQVGGADLSSTGSLLFDNNTIADNLSAATGTRAVNCETPQNAMLRNNLVTHSQDFSSNCPFTSSQFVRYAGFLSPTNRAIAAPGYLSPIDGDYHISRDSDAHSAGTETPDTRLNLDIDGEIRPWGVLDVGADEIE